MVHLIWPNLPTLWQSRREFAKILNFILKMIIWVRHHLIRQEFTSSQSSHWHNHHIGHAWRASSDLSLPFEYRYYFTAFAIDKAADTTQHRSSPYPWYSTVLVSDHDLGLHFLHLFCSLQEVTVCSLGNRPKLNNGGFQTFLAIASDISFHPTFTVNIRLTTASQC